MKTRQGTPHSLKPQAILSALQVQQIITRSYSASPKDSVANPGLHRTLPHPLIYHIDVFLPRSIQQCQSKIRKKNLKDYTNQLWEMES